MKGREQWLLQGNHCFKDRECSPDFQFRVLTARAPRISLFYAIVHCHLAVFQVMREKILENQTKTKKPNQLINQCQLKIDAFVLRLSCHS